MRRHDKRLIPLLVGVFVTTFSFVFLMNHSKTDFADAANLANFKPGNIISDYTMSNYNSMTLEEIQSFLTSKNACSNRDYNYYLTLTRTYPGISWHWENNHFVCLSEERFGDGTVIGEGKTAAQIIYETAQEYKINPQVLIVLIEKESSLITDPIPNNRDYRTMTGFGCPDTAPCDSQYFGFKNQIRKAAWLFREVLDGGWTNYPLGENYIQYNPNASCGGSIVNIENLATSALYRYTPYQPNAGALAAGTGTAYCGAYGNRNFYIYFNDWFGDPTALSPIEWINSSTPRNMTTTQGTQIYNLKKKIWEPYAGGETYFFNKKATIDNKLCLKAQDNNKKDVCFLFDTLKNYVPVWESSTTPRYLKVEEGKAAIDTLTMKTASDYFGQQSAIFFNIKTILPNGETCVRNESMEDNHCYLLQTLFETPEVSYWQKSITPRLMEANKGARQLNLITGEVITTQDAFVSFYSMKISTPQGVCVRNYKDSEKNENMCMIISDLSNIPNGNWVPAITPRILSSQKDAMYLSLSTLRPTDVIAKPTYWYDQKIQLPNNEVCVGNSNDDMDSCVILKELNEQNE